MKSLRKVYRIHASAEQVFHALTDLDMIMAWTEDEAEMDARPGGKWFYWGGTIHGINLEVGPGKLVQHWKEESWPTWSKVTFSWKEEGDETVLELIHQDIPDKRFASINEGWDRYYLTPIKEMLENQ